MTVLTPNVIDEGVLPSISTVATSMDGTRGPSGGAGYRSSIWSHGDHIYVAQNASAASLSTRIMKIRKSDGAELQKVTVGGTYSQDAIVGHTAPQVCVAPDGTVFARPASHLGQQGMLVWHTTTPEDLSTFTASPQPSATDDWRINYRNFYLAPDGTPFLWARGYWPSGESDSFPEGYGLLWRWTGTAWVNAVGAGDTPLQFGGTNTRPYQFDLTFDDAGTIWGVGAIQPAFDNGGSAVWTAPRCVKSADQGATWAGWDGSAVTLPITLDTGGNEMDGPAHHRARVVLDEQERPVTVYGWVGPDYTGGLNNTDALPHLTLWASRWDGSSFDYVQLEPPDTNYDVRSQQQVIRDSTGKIMVVAVRASAPHDLCLWVHVPGEPFATWHRYKITDGANAAMAYWDPEGWRDGVVRFLPTTES